MAASSTTATGSAQGARAGDNQQRARTARDGGTASAFAEALDEQQRALGEAEQDSRIARSRQRRPAAQPEAISATADSAVSRRLPDDKPVADQDAMAETTEGAGKPTLSVEPDTSGDKPDEGKADGEAAAVAPAPSEPEAAVPVAVVQPPVVPAEAGAASPADGEIAPPAVIAPATPGQTEAPAQAQTTLPVAEVAAEPPAAAKPAVAPAPAEAATPSGAQPEVVQAVAKAASRPDIRAEMRGEARAEAPPPQPQAAAPAATEAGPAPAQQPAAPAPAGPLSFAHEVAQKVAAQTQAAGSVVPVHALAVTIAARASTGSTRFDIKLDPPELGRIEVQMTLDREGRVKSRLVVEKQETLELLQRDQRNLERTLAQAGLDTSEGGIEFSLKDQGGEGRHNDNERPARSWQVAVDNPDATTAPAANAATYSRLAAARGGIDIRI